MKMLFITLASISLLFSGCNTIDSGFNKLGYQKISDFNAKLRDIDTKYNAQLAVLDSQYQSEAKKIEKINNDKLQNIANELFSANYAFTLNLTPDRNSFVVNYHVRSAQEFVGRGPTTEGVEKALKDVKNELDEKLTSLEQLNKEFERTKQKAANLEREKADAENAIEKIKKDKEDVIKSKDVEIKNTEKAKDEEIKNILNNQQGKLDKLTTDLENQRIKDRNAIIRALSIGAGILSVGALLFAIYGPISTKFESAIAAVILGGAAAALPFIETWMVVLGIISCIILLGGWGIVKYHKTKKISDKTLKTERVISKNLINVVQDIKEKHPETYDTIVKPLLSEWNTVVMMTSGGEVNKIPDTDIIKAIDSKLIESDRK